MSTKNIVQNPKPAKPSATVILLKLPADRHIKEGEIPVKPKVFKERP